MLAVDAGVTVGVAVVKTTEKGGFTADQVAEMAVEKIIHVSDGTVAPLRDQAHAFKDHIQTILCHYMKFAIEQDRATVCAELRKAGYGDLAEHFRSI
jgi:hypothetical protein|tara:strand:- start:1257 stop:1547 length:291 start_codon:yes stop_codon:yes gene_type:complete